MFWVTGMHGLSSYNNISADILATQRVHACLSFEVEYKGFQLMSLAPFHQYDIQGLDEEKGRYYLRLISAH